MSKYILYILYYSIYTFKSSLLDLLYILKRNVGQNIQISGENCGYFHAKCPFMLNADVKKSETATYSILYALGKKLPDNHILHWRKS